MLAAIREAAESNIGRGLARVHRECAGELRGHVASYIPELATVDPDPFGLALASVRGALWTCGEAEHEFTIRSVSKAAGRDLALSAPVYRSESETGHRNRAIGHLLLNVGALAAPVEPALDLYFRQCSILITATDLACMGATLANLGTNPATREVVFDIGAVRDTLSVMLTCGMYDYSGRWVLDVGIPAKSGAGGGVVGVVNRQLGIGSCSPRLDPKGNSVRGLKAFRLLADEFGLHAFECTNYGSELIRGMQ